MRKLITAYLLEHSQHDERYLGMLSDKDLLALYDETRDVVTSLEHI